MSLRSTSNIHLQLSNGPRTNNGCGDRAFSVAAPTCWNTLPLHIRDSSLISSFKTRLKTHLFRQCQSALKHLWKALYKCYYYFIICLQLWTSYIAPLLFLQTFLQQLSFVFILHITDGCLLSHATFIWSQETCRKYIEFCCCVFLILSRDLWVCFTLSF